MFFTFNSTMAGPASSRGASALPPGPRSDGTARSRQRSRSFKACKRCRLHRIKCGEKPCEPCRANNAKCVWREESVAGLFSPSSTDASAPGSPSMPLGPDTASSADRSTVPRAASSEGDDSARANILSSATTNSSAAASLSSSVDNGLRDCFSASARSSPPGPPDMVRKAQLFFQDISPALAPDEVQPNPFPPLPQEALGWGSHAGHPGNAFSPLGPLNWDKQVYFIRLFWTTWGPLFPIMAESEFQSLLAARPQGLLEQRTVSSALIDGITAVGIQYAHAAGFGGRILGFGPAAYTSAADSVHQLGLQYFTRCRNCLREEGSRVTVDAIRCYIVLALYQLQANRVESAYYMVGLGVRRAHMSKLHLPPPAHLPAQETAGRIHAWWLLYWLDVHCSMQLDRPAAVHRSSITSPPPTDPRGSPAFSEAAFGCTPCKGIHPCTYLSFFSKLTIAVAEALEGMPATVSMDAVASPSTLEELAERLFYSMRRLEAWLVSLPEELVNPRERGARSASGSTTGSAEDGSFSFAAPGHQANAQVALELGIPDWLQRQRIMLELYYSHACVLLQRPFVLWWRSSGQAADPATQLPRTKRHADGAVQHACSVISILHSVYSRSDILDGLSMALQCLWNASTTLAVYMSACPHEPQTAQLAPFVTNAVAILESLSQGSPQALHVYHVVRSLASRLRDVTGANIGQQRGPSPRLDPAFLLSPTDYPGLTSGSAVSALPMQVNAMEGFMVGDMSMPGVDFDDFESYAA